MSDDLAETVARYHEAFWGSPAAEFARLRGWTHSTIERFALGYVELEHWGPCLAFPYQSGLFQWRGFRYRRLADRKPKVIAPGFKIHLFAIRAADEAFPVICEGESDCLVSWQCGMKAVGVPGALNWKPEWAWLFRDAREVVLAFDADDAGHRGSHKISRSLTKAGVNWRTADIPEGRDLNDLYLEAGASRVREVLGL